MIVVHLTEMAPCTKREMAPTMFLKPQRILFSKLQYYNLYVLSIATAINL